MPFYMASDSIELQSTRPWLVTKQYFTMLTLIIPRKGSITSSNVDVYLQPLVNELHVLWRGVKAWDAYLGASFSPRAMCMWSTHDFLDYGLFASCVTKGQVGCPPCGPTT
jgi:hypothetical protein